MKNRTAAVLIYGALLAVGISAAWGLAAWLLPLVSGPSLGACLGAIFAALYIGELKQESINQLYQALAAANLRSAELAVFSDQALARVRSIRRLFLLSNVVKLLGALGGMYLLNEKTASPSEQIIALRFGLETLFLSLLLFARLYAEVSSTESLLLAIKQQAALKAKRDAFLAAGKSAKSHDFSSDPAAQSFEAPQGEPLLMPAGQ